MTSVAASVKNHEQMTDGVTARDRDIRRGRKKREEMRRVKMGVGTGKGKKKNITVVTIEIDSLPQSELSSFSLSNLLTLFLPFLLLLLS